MKSTLVKYRPVHPYELGYRTMLECNDLEQAKRICSLQLLADEDLAYHELQRLHAEIAEAKHHASSLHSYLYGRPEPVNDGKMLSHRRKLRILVVFALLAALACLVGNMTTFYLLGFALLLTFLCGSGMTALPVVVGHLGYEWIIALHRWFKVAVVVTATVLLCAGILRISQARSDMADRAASTPHATSYVDSEDDSPANAQPRDSAQVSESGIHRTLGEGMLLIMLAADLALAFLVGWVIEMYSDDDFTSWNTLRDLSDLAMDLGQRISQIVMSFEVAKKQCLAGILKAQNARSRRPPPYHRGDTMLLLLVIIIFFLASVPVAWCQEGLDGVLIDTSASISRGGKSHELFHQYLVAARKLLLTEPPNTRVWVSNISSDSFGRAPEILRGWTPEARGVFTDDLNRARLQLASTFGTNSAKLTPSAQGTDILGGLWRLKDSFESARSVPSVGEAAKSIWIFSDMMNETNEFPMPQLLETGPERMLERAKARGLLVPLAHYKVHIYGASPAALTPRSWMTVRRFWEMYFASAGADLVVYSIASDVRR